MLLPTKHATPCLLGSITMPAWLDQHIASTKGPSEALVTLSKPLQSRPECVHLQQLPPQLLPTKLLGHIPVHLQAAGVQVNIAVP
jgi:hypothetical protein